MSPKEPALSECPFLPGRPLWPEFRQTVKRLLAVRAAIPPGLRGRLGEPLVQFRCVVHAARLVCPTITAPEVVRAVMALEGLGGFSDAEVCRNVPIRVKRPTPGERSILLRLVGGLGDALVFTGVIASMKRAHPELRVGVDTPHSDAFTGSPDVSELDARDHATEVYNIDLDYPPLSEIVTGHQGHYSELLYEVTRMKTGLAFARHQLEPVLHLPESGAAADNPVRSDLGHCGKYWLVNAGYKPGEQLKWWGGDRYQEVVDAMRGKVQFVQLGHAGDVHPRLRGALDLVGKTSLRQLIFAARDAEASLGPASAHMHLMAAFRKPSFVIAGGREPAYCSAYDGHRWFDTVGLMPCCLHRGCQFYLPQACHSLQGMVPECMRLIEPQEVVRQIEVFLSSGAALGLDHWQRQGKIDAEFLSTAPAMAVNSGPPS